MRLSIQRITLCALVVTLAVPGALAHHEHTVTQEFYSRLNAAEGEPTFAVRGKGSVSPAFCSGPLCDLLSVEIPEQNVEVHANYFFMKETCDSQVDVQTKIAFATDFSDWEQSRFKGVHVSYWGYYWTPGMNSGPHNGMQTRERVTMFSSWVYNGISYSGTISVGGALAEARNDYFVVEKASLTLNGVDKAGLTQFTWYGEGPAIWADFWSQTGGCNTNGGDLGICFTWDCQDAILENVPCRDVSSCLPGGGGGSGGGDPNPDCSTTVEILVAYVYVGCYDGYINGVEAWKECNSQEGLQRYGNEYGGADCPESLPPIDLPPIGPGGTCSDSTVIHIEVEGGVYIAFVCENGSYSNYEVWLECNYVPGLQREAHPDGEYDSDCFVV
jgi:hypothetical protein